MENLIISLCPNYEIERRSTNRTNQQDTLNWIIDDIREHNHCIIKTKKKKKVEEERV